MLYINYISNYITIKFKMITYNGISIKKLPPLGSLLLLEQSRPTPFQYLEFLPELLADVLLWFWQLPIQSWTIRSQHTRQWWLLLHDLQFIYYFRSQIYRLTIKTCFKWFVFKGLVVKKINCFVLHISKGIKVTNKYYITIPVTNKLSVMSPLWHCKLNTNVWLSQITKLHNFFSVSMIFTIN